VFIANLQPTGVWFNGFPLYKNYSLYARHDGGILCSVIYRKQHKEKGIITKLIVV
jgi:hypothetical protein